MKYPVFSIRDLKAEFMTPRIEQNEASAKRSFAMMVNAENTLISFSPSDFELYYVGDFDAESGRLISVDIPQFIIRGDDLVGAK